MKAKRPLLVGMLSVGVAVFAGCGDDPDGDNGVGAAGTGGGAAGTGDGVRILGTMAVQEGNYLGNQSAKVNANFKAEQPKCGVEVEEFGQCSITTRTQVACAPDCATGKVCAWKADCSAGECVDVVAYQAGVITITGAAHQDPLTCSYNAALDPPIYECDVDATQNVFDPGDALTIVASGDAFPAFSHTVTTPPAHSFTTDTASWTAATFDGSGDVLLEWDATQTADEFKLTVISGSGRSLVCHFPDSGSFSIPKEGIATLGSEVVQVDIHRQNAVVIDEGDHALTIMTVEGLAVPVSGSCYSCSRYLQSCQTACPDMNEVCDGASRDAATALDDCLCAECGTECALTCTGSGTDTDCKPCKQGAMSGACSAQRSACSSN